MNNECLDYERQFFVDTFDESFLLIASKGLCTERFFYKHLQLYSDPSVLVLVINVGKAEQDYFCKCLVENGQPEPIRLTSQTGTAERRSLYLEGGVQFATTTILISDLLSDRIPLHLVTGILVYKAHSVLRSALESFILLMFQKRKPDGFVKAFSDSPGSFVRTFGQLQRAVVLLQVKRVRFLPRYHLDVIQALDNFRPDLVELAIQLTPSMNVCQKCLTELIQACLLELKRCQLPLDNELSLEYALLPWFEDKIQKELEAKSSFDRLTDKVRRLLSDISRLRQLLASLETDDGNTFKKKLQAIKNNAKEYKNNSGWLFTTAAEKLFDVGTKRSGEMPTKWHALKTVLKELAEIQVKQNLIIFASEETVCTQLKDLIQDIPPSSSTSSAEKTEDVNSEDDKVESQKSDEHLDLDKWLPEDSLVYVGLDKDLQLETSSNRGFTIVLLPYVNRLEILRTLTVFEPSAVILFSVDIWTVRQLELYNAVVARQENSRLKFRVYFLMYQNSVEEQRYLTSLKQERESFEQLFKEETTLLIRRDVDGDGEFSCRDSASADLASSQNVIVDMREFRSELPTLLHLRNLKLIPATLLVGDYVLSPEICIERKATSDLIGSLQSGRLFTQCRSMSQYYTRPVLLIELQTGRRCWRRFGDHCSAKLAVLSMNFPQLRFVWATSPSAAGDLLADFKWKRDEPDLERALACGKPDETDSERTRDADDEERRTRNKLQIERMLMTMPGVTSKNLHTLTKRLISVRDLCKFKNTDQLADALQWSPLAATNLSNFLTKDFRVANVGNNKKDVKIGRKRK